MEVIIAEYAGICFGVRRALALLEESVETADEKNAKVVMLGPLIHNPRVVERYSKKGVDVVDVESTPEKGVVVVRSHGVTKQVEEKLSENRSLEVVDTTCPYVKRIHQLVEKKSAQGIAVVVMGDRDHSEVEGIASRISGPFLVVSPDFCKNTLEELKKFLDENDKVFVVAQTTSRPVNYRKLVKEIKKTCDRKKVDVSQTICTATLKRQDSARELSSRVDAIIVVGGKNSSNTSKLFQVVSASNEKSFWVESPEDFNAEDIDVLKKLKKIGITAGASTPDDQIEEMKEFLEKLDDNG